VKLRIRDNRRAWGAVADAGAFEIGALELAMSLGGLRVGSGARELLLLGRAAGEIDAIPSCHDAALLPEPPL
jgi:hypothetical protein